MKIFQRYNPLKIARYVQMCFVGSFYINGIGFFEFQNGKIVCPKVKDLQRLGVMSEINRQIVKLQREALV
ncbi:DUF1107 family protein [Conservatibacter flavescens]|uniref:DUF1107 domain-containing protein n=1 Tax=Conservatibacter flavescens TaxID=28161 RepID=A0A2M8S5T7_9PAST|nr:DUF1107 family protein [Conservatibacter flavescens]PJG86509.1 hypothetical protein CVP05_01510 [Conservatibacter flavescens]